MRKLTGFLDSMRQATGENQNNGVVLLFRGFEELCLMARLFQLTSNDNILLDTVKGFGCLEDVVNDFNSTSNAAEPFVYSRPVRQDAAAYFHASVSRGSEVHKLTSKNKAESVYRALEHLLKEPPGYKSFVHKYCMPSRGNRVFELGNAFKTLQSFFKMEKYVAAKVKSGASTFSSNHCGAWRCRTMSRDVEVVAYRISKMLVNLGVDMTWLMNRCHEDPSYSVAWDPTLTDKIPRHESELTSEQSKPFHDAIRMFFTELL